MRRSELMLLIADVFVFGPLDWLIFAIVPLIYCADRGWHDGATLAYRPMIPFRPIAVGLGCCLIYLIVGTIATVANRNFDGFLSVFGSALYCCGALLLIGGPVCFLSYYLMFRFISHLARKQPK